MKENKPNEIKVRVRDGAQFYSNDTSINVSPTEFIIDFKCMSQVQDMAGHSALTITHNAIILTPFHAKSLSEILTKALKDYEKKFSKIEKPSAIKKAEKYIKDRVKKETVTQKEDPSESYIG